MLSERHKLDSANSSIKVIIEEFLECNSCGQRLCDAVKLKKIHMEYSFLRFLQQLFLSGGHSRR